MKYTKSENYDTFSYHVIIPKYNANLKTQLYLVKQIKEDSGFNEIYLSVYENKIWLRLPNQSNNEKPVIRSIINGQMSDFLLDSIQPKSSIFTIEENKDIKPKIKREIFELTDINKTYATDK
jgi:hypothetical protein